MDALTIGVEGGRARGLAPLVAKEATTGATTRAPTSLPPFVVLTRAASPALTVDGLPRFRRGVPEVRVPKVHVRARPIKRVVARLLKSVRRTTTAATAAVGAQGHPRRCFPKLRPYQRHGVVKLLEPYDPVYSKSRRLARFYQREKVVDPGLRGCDTLPTWCALNQRVDTHALLAGLRRRPYKESQDVGVDLFLRRFQRAALKLLEQLRTPSPGRFKLGRAKELRVVLNPLVK